MSWRHVNWAPKLLLSSWSLETQGENARGKHRQLIVGHSWQGWALDRPDAFSKLSFNVPRLLGGKRRRGHIASPGDHGQR